MPRNQLIYAIILLASILLAPLVLPPHGIAKEPGRFALLIGNSTYTKAVGPLINPHNDVELVGASLKKIGFEVTTIKDASYRDMDKALKRHEHRVRRAGRGAISFIYYSGHGVANPENRVNYIIPTDVTEVNNDLWINSFRQQDLVDRLERYVPDAIHYVVFDACRNELKIADKYAKSLGTNKGFTPIANPAGVLIAYATAPGETASDKGIRGGAYAKALSQELVRPGIEAVTMFRKVQLRVASAINQEPWLKYGTLPEVYLAGRDRPEVIAWKAIKDSNDVTKITKYLKQFPDGIFSDSARFKIQVLNNERQNKTATEAWKLIETSSDEAVLAGYVKKYRNSPYAEVARFRLTALAERRLQNRRLTSWKAVQNSTDPQLLRKFILQHPDTFFARLAEEKIASLQKPAVKPPTELERAAAAWQQLRNLDKAEPFQDFLESFGNTPFGALAEARLNVIQQRNAKRAEIERREKDAAERRRKKVAQEAEQKRLAALEAERIRLSELEAKRKQLAAQEAERKRLAALEAERERLAALEAERKRLEEEAILNRQKAKEIERVRLAALAIKRQQEEAEAAERERQKAREAEATLKELVKSLQSELNRVGCSPGVADGVWGAKSRKAISLYNEHSGEKLDALSPTLVALETVRKHDKRICPVVTAKATPTKRETSGNQNKARIKQQKSNSKTASRSQKKSVCAVWRQCMRDLMNSGKSMSRQICGNNPFSC